MIGLIVLALTLGASWFGYSSARRYVRERLRYVEAALTPGAAIVAGIAAATVVAPLVWLLPWVGAKAAIIFGLGTGLGARAGAADVKRGYRITAG